MPDIWLYPQVKAFVPNARPPNDVVLMDVTRHWRPFFKHDPATGRAVKFTPKEQGLPPFRSMSNVLTGGFKPEEILVVVEAKQKQDAEIAERKKETEERRAVRQEEYDLLVRKKLWAGESMEDAKMYVSIRKAYEAMNRKKKEARLRVEDATKLQNRIKMAKLRARRGRK